MFLEAPPDTSAYMIAGYVIAFLVMGLYCFSLYLRHRNLRRDLETLEAVSWGNKPKSESKRGGAAKPGKKGKLPKKKE